MNRRNFTQYRVTRALARLTLTGLFWSAALPIVRGSETSVARPPLLLTNIAGLGSTGSTQPNQVVSVRLEGAVWWANSASGRVILADDSGVEQLEFDFPCQMPTSGDRLRLEGNCLLARTKDAIKLTCIPVVDNDGLHSSPGEKNGSIYLEAGRHPIRVAWFNRTSPSSSLEVSYDGPGMPRQRIPDSVLFRSASDSSQTATSQVAGLDYRCCEGMYWSVLPDLHHLAAARSGSASNFDVAVSTRQGHVGLLFSGYIAIAREGLYTFRTRSSDGSRLYVGNSSIAAEVVGKAALPMPGKFAVGLPAAEMPNYFRAEIEGTVTFVDRLQDDREWELSVGTESVQVFVAGDSQRSFPLLPQQRVRVSGVYHDLFDVEGHRFGGECFVQDWTDIAPSAQPPKLIRYPLVTIGDLTLQADAPLIVRVRGSLGQSINGGPLALEDGNDRIELEAGSAAGQPGQDVEMLGVLRFIGTNRVLRAVRSTPLSEVPNEAEALPELTTVEQVYQLDGAESGRGYPVKLRGVVTSLWAYESVILQDATRGVFIALPRLSPPFPGDHCEIEGITSSAFAPYVVASRIQILGSASLPTPLRPTRDQLLSGSMHCQYVELEGVVTACGSNSITLLTRDGRINVMLSPMEPQLQKAYENALVQLRGCLIADFGRQSPYVQVGNLFVAQQSIHVVEPAPEDVFAMPAKAIGDLLRFDPHAGALQRAKVTGQIIHQGSGGCFLMDGENGLRFVLAEGATAHTCDRAEVVGFPDWSGASPLLREAVVRRLGVAELPQPRELEPDNLLQDAYDSTLVQLEGVLVEITREPERTVLEMQSGLQRFAALLDKEAGVPDAMVLGSQLQLTGVYVGLGGDRVLARPIESFQLLLNSTFDIRVLARPPWWTLKRLLAVVGILICVLLAALVWIRLLHQQVGERTLQLEAHIQRRQQAERQRQIEQERSRVARDLHDELGAGLTRVNILTSLVNSPATPADDKTRHLLNLNEIARDMVTSLDEIVWAVNPRNDTLASLVAYFCAHAGRLLALASIKCGLEVAEDLPDCPLDSKFRHEILLSFKEAITNVIRHSDATRVMLRIAIRERHLIIEVVDDGRGIGPGKADAGADGLANIQKRLAALSGRCEIQTGVGKGTSIRLEAPLPGNWA